jgi:hypothetical protein
MLKKIFALSTILMLFSCSNEKKIQFTNLLVIIQMLSAAFGSKYQFE